MYFNPRKGSSICCHHKEKFILLGPAYYKRAAKTEKIRKMEKKTQPAASTQYIYLRNTEV